MKMTHVESNCQNKICESLQGPKNVTVLHPLYHQKIPWIHGEPAGTQIKIELKSFISTFKKTEVSWKVFK